MHDIGRTLLRRWLFVLPALTLSLGCCVLAARAVPASYTADANIVLVPPDSTVNPPTDPGTEAPRGNPYLYLGGLDQAVAVVVRSVDSAQTHEAVADKAPGDFEITPDYTTSAPLLVVKTEGSTREATEDLLAVVLEQVPASLGDLQQRLQVPTASRITTFVVSSSPTPSVDRKLQSRVVALAGVLSLAIFALLIAAGDGLAERRRRARGAPPEDDTDDDSSLGAPVAPAPTTPVRARPSTIRTIKLARRAPDDGESSGATAPTGT